MKRAIVTGSTKGIGKSIGIELLKKGDYVVFNYNNSDNDATQLDEELKDKYFGKYSIFKADLSNMKGMQLFLDECLKIHASWDYLILNTGITDKSDFGDITVENWQNVMNANLNIPFFLV